MDDFSIQHERKGNAIVVTISGRVDSVNSAMLDAELTKIMIQEKNLVLDLKDTAFLSSAGVRAIIKAFQAAKKAGGAVKLACIPTPVAKVLTTTGIMEMLEGYPSVEGAAASF